MDDPIRFQEFSFDYKTGELIRHEESGQQTSARLAPQPCKMLLLLIQTYPEIVTQEKIKQKIWPDVQVDFESSIHFCIRQIRSVLNDNATEPRFIQTIPKRGYRWIAPYEFEGKDIHDLERGESLSISGSARNRDISFHNFFNKKIFQSKSNKQKILAIALLALLSLSGYFLIANSFAKHERTSDNSAKTRVAIMSFDPPSDSHLFKGNDIALKLLENLTNEHKNTLRVVGPTSTTNYQADQLQSLLEDFDIDYIINGRFSETDDSGRLLAEIIRASDGAHIWVKYYNSAVNPSQITQEICSGLIEQLNRGKEK